MKSYLVAIIIGLWTMFTISNGLEMKQDTYFYVGQSGESAQLSCQLASDEFFDSCSFIRPDGKKVCRYEADQDCTYDSNLYIKDTIDECVLEIVTVDPGQHLGTWKCQIGVFGKDKPAQADVQLDQAKDAEVEFHELWGKVNIDIKSGLEEITFRCNAVAESGEEVLQTPPGSMTWTMGGVELARQNDWKQDGQVWYQTFTYTPDIWEDGKDLTCILNQGGANEKTSKIILFMSLFDLADQDNSGDNPTLELVDGQEEAEFSRSFQAYPKPEAEWVVQDKSDGSVTRIIAGSRVGRYEADNLLAKPDNYYEAYLRMTDIKHIDDQDKEINLVVKIRDKSNVVTVPFVIKDPIKNKSEVTEPPTTTELPSSVTASGVPTTKPPVSSTGVGLYIIIAIIALVILICALYYGCKCCKKKNESGKPDYNPNDNSAKNAEEGQAFINDGANAGQGSQDKDKPLKDKEQELIDKLEPKGESSEDDATNEVTEPRTYADVVKEGSGFPPGNLAGNHDKAADDHAELDRMAKVIKQISDAKEPEKEDEKLAKAEPFKDDPDPPLNDDKADENFHKADTLPIQDQTKADDRKDNWRQYGGGSTIDSSETDEFPKQAKVPPPTNIGRKMSGPKSSPPKSPLSNSSSASTSPALSPVPKSPGGGTNTGTQTPKLKLKDFTFDSDDDNLKSGKDKPNGPEQSMHMNF